MATRFCAHCGAAVDAAMTFCGHCGTVLAPAAAATAAPGAMPPPVMTAPVAAPLSPAATAPVACPRCGTLNPSSAAFCGRCAQPLAAGVAAPSGAVGGAPVYPLATQAQAAAALQHKTGKRHHWFLIGGGVLVSMIALAVVAVLIAPPPPGPCAHGCPPPPPPNSPPLAALNKYTSTTYGYSLEYSSADLAPAKMDGTSIGWAGSLRSNGAPVSWNFSGDAANGRTAQGIVDSLQQANFHDASYLYTIPGAALGYLSGYGKVYSMTLTPASGQAMNGRLIVMAAVRDNVAVELVGIGPYQQTTYSDGHPNPAQTPIVNWFDLNVNTVLWKGEAPL